MKKRAVIIFNLGGPDSLEAIQPFLFNLFSDPAIISLPGPLRRLLAKRISTKRAPITREIYAHIGGCSPLLELTRAQAEALEQTLGDGYRVFVCMRYWHPMSEVVAKEVAAWQPDEIVLLPLYPQFSTTTTESSLVDWQRHGLDQPCAVIGCYPTEDGLVHAHAERLATALKGLERPRILFSAHGLPEAVIARGDPYQWQVEQSVDKIVKSINNLASSKATLEAYFNKIFKDNELLLIKKLLTEAEVKLGGLHEYFENELSAFVQPT